MGNSAVKMPKKRNNNLQGNYLLHSQVFQFLLKLLPVDSEE